MAQLFAFQGVQAVGADFDKKSLNQTIKNLTKHSQEALVIKTDVSSLAAVRNLFKAAKDEFSKTDIVVNDTGIMDHMTAFR